MCDCVIHDIINGGDPRRAWGGKKWWLEVKKQGKSIKHIGS